MKRISTIFIAFVMLATFIFAALPPATAHAETQGSSVAAMKASSSMDCDKLAYKWWDSIYGSRSNASLQWMTSKCKDGRISPYRLRLVLSTSSKPGKACLTDKNQVIVGVYVYLQVFKVRKDGTKKGIWARNLYMPCEQEGWSSGYLLFNDKFYSWPRKTRFRVDYVWQIAGKPESKWHHTVSKGYVRPLKKANLTFMNP